MIARNTVIGMISRPAYVHFYLVPVTLVVSQLLLPLAQSVMVSMMWDELV
jgi:hypothetical protein